MKTLFASNEQRYEVAKQLAHLLRVDAHSAHLSPDDYGWVKIETLMPVMRTDFPFVGLEHICEIAEKDAQRRFAILEGMVRARAGHRYPVKNVSEPILPPDVLFHGTSPESLSEILAKGILPMGKAFVHLASTMERAKRVGLRKNQTPVILAIAARKAHDKGVSFWKSGQVSPDGEIYLSDTIPPDFISVVRDA